MSRCVCIEWFRNDSKRFETFKRWCAITLRKIRKRIGAEIYDTAQGFDMNEAGAKSGLGCVFISERVRLRARPAGDVRFVPRLGRNSNYGYHSALPKGDVQERAGFEGIALAQPL